MSTKKRAKPAAVSAPAAAAPVLSSAAVIPLNEFCARLSESDRRVSLIGGFHADESAAGRLKDQATAYSSRYVAYCKRPIA